MLSFLLATSTVFPGRAAAQVSIIDTWVEYNFGDQITFRLKLSSEKPIETAVIFFQASNDTHTSVDLATVKPLEDDVYDITYVHNINDYSLPAFSKVDFRFELTLEGGVSQEIPPATFFYEDNRYEWKTLSENYIQVHWYEGDLQFAQSVLDVAQSGLARVQDLLELPSTGYMDIYVYPDVEIMQATLRNSGENWVAGHADPELGMIVVALPEGPEQRLLMEQRVPHELMHVILYQSTYPGYHHLPLWLNEGLASIAELYPNPDYELLLDNAAQNDSLLPMASLCDAFPRDASNALLSYAQSASFTRYIHDTYGKSRLHDLATAYANGLSCERGAQSALGRGLSQLQKEWQREELGSNRTLKILNNLIPWLLLMAVALSAPLIMAFRKLRARPSTHVISNQAN